MRRIHRGGLPITTRLEMYRRGKLCVDSVAARAEWKSFRSSVATKPVVAELKRMAGVTGRCFYCSDSKGADVEHYFPVAEKAAYTMRWSNLLWVCPECNRKKNATFPEENGEPLLIDPSATDPWSQLVPDISTGMLAPRFRGQVPDRGATETLRVLDILNQEAVAEGRRKSIRRLLRAAAKLAESADLPAKSEELWLAVDDDDYGVAAWFALWEGQRSMPFSTIKQTQPQMWRHFVREVARPSRPRRCPHRHPAQQKA